MCGIRGNFVVFVGIGWNEESEWALIGSLLFTPATGITLWGPVRWIPGESCTNESFNMYTHLVMLPCYVNISL